MKCGRDKSDPLEMSARSQFEQTALNQACRRVYLLAAILACTIVPIVLCNTVYYAVLLMMND